MADTAIVSKASDVQLTTLSVISPTGTSVSLLHVMSELNIFEDLFSPCMSGNIVVNDSLNLINKIPIIGSEYLLVTFEKPGSTVSFKKVFRIYKITDRSRTNQQNETYIIHFASEELLLSESVVVSKTFFDQTISTMVKTIATQYLNISRQKLPDSSIENTLGLQQVIIPNWHPFYAINWLARRALSSHKGASYIWYEDRDGYNFVSIESLIKQAPITQLKVSPKNSGGSDELLVSQDGLEVYAFDEAFDTLRSINSGMYAGQLFAADPLRRRVQTSVLKVPNFFEVTHHSEKNPFLMMAKDRFQQTLSDHVEANQRVYPMVSEAESVSYMKGKITQRSNNVDQWMLQRDMYLANLHAIRVTGVLPGTTNFQVGKTVDLLLPSSEEQEKGGKKLDLIFSGKYIITGLRHKINKKSYACIAEFSKDSIAPKLPEAPGLNSIEQIKGM